MELVKYTKDFLHWAEVFLKEKSPEPTTRRLCISFSANELCFIYLDKVNDYVKILESKTIKYKQLKELTVVLLGIIRQHQLAYVPIYWLLSPDNYQLFLIESLPVAKEEFYQALSWRVRSLITYPIEDAVLDYFMLPPKRNSLSNAMIAAVTSPMNELMKIIDLFNSNSMQIKTIYIPELALRNLTSSYEDDEKSTAMLYFYENQAILNITQQKTLYFTHRINWNSKTQLVKENYEQISLEILRYFDYFQSQWRYPAPSRVFVASEKEDADLIAKFISEYLLLSVQTFSPKINCNKNLDKKFHLLLGCGISEIKENVTAGN